MSVVHKRIKVHLGQGQNLIVSIKIYLKYKYTYENAGFCVLCTDDLIQNIKKFEQIIEIFHVFHRETSQAQLPPPTPQRPYDVSRGQNRYMTLPLGMKFTCRVSVLRYKTLQLDCNYNITVLQHSGFFVHGLVSHSTHDSSKGIVLI